MAAIFSSGTANSALYTTTTPASLKSVTPSDCTFIAYVYPTTLAAGAKVALSVNSHTDSRGFHLYTATTSAGNVRTAGGGGTTANANSTGQLTTNSWQMMAGKFWDDGGGVGSRSVRAASHNGENWGTGTTTDLATMANIEVVSIGARMNTGSTSTVIFDGKIAYVGIWLSVLDNTALSTLAGYIGGTVSMATLVAAVGAPAVWWDLVSNGNASTDYGGASYNLTDLSGTGVTFDTDKPFTISSGTTTSRMTLLGVG